MDVTLAITVVSTILSLVLLGATGAVVVYVARKRGLAQVEARTDSEVQKTLEAQDRRIALQDREIADLKAQVSALQLQVATLTTDLHSSDAQVRRLVAQQHAQAGDGR